VLARERTASAALPLEAVRSQIVEALLAERGAEAVRRFVAERRPRYLVRVE
jgi:hypothetical protein